MDPGRKFSLSISVHIYILNLWHGYNSGDYGGNVEQNHVDPKHCSSYSVAIPTIEKMCTLPAG